MKTTVTIATLAGALALSACGGTTTNEAAGNYNDAAFDNLVNGYEELPVENANEGFGDDSPGNDATGANMTVPATGAGGQPTSNASAVGN